MKPPGPYSQTYDPNEIIDILAELDVRPATDAECEGGRVMAAERINPDVATVETVRRVRDRTGRATAFVQTCEGVVTGVAAILPLLPEGLRAVEGHSFSPKNPADELLSRPGDPLAAMYVWGFASTTREAASAVVSACVKLRDHYSDLPFFVRAATPAGLKVLCGRMGYSPYPGAPDGLLWNPVRTNQERAA